MTKMAALARELRDALDNLPLSTKKLSEMFRNHGDKTTRNSSDLTDLDDRLAALGDSIVKAEKKDRPDAEDYLPQSYIDRHLDQFSSGVSRFQGQDGYNDYGPFRKDGTSFVLPSSEVNGILARANGDIGAVEAELGLPPGTFGDGPLIVVDFPTATPEHLRMPSGREDGANEHWIPYGETSGGVPEAVLRSDSPGSDGHAPRLDKGGNAITFGRR